MKLLKSVIAILVLSSLAANATTLPAGNSDQFENIELMQANGDNLRETAVRVIFGDTSMRVVARSNAAVMKEWPNDKIKMAEYSNTKNPRWKTGLGFGAASIVFPLLLIVAIPVGFTKLRRQWVTI